MTVSAATSPSKTSTGELRSGWPLVAAAFFGVLVSFASVFIYTFGVFLKPLSAEFNWSRAQISAGFSIAALTVACTSPLIGRFADRVGVKGVVALTSAVFGVSLASLSLLTASIWHFYAVLFVIGMIGNGTTQLPWARAITSRFDASRGLALSLMMAGGGLGSMLMPWAATAMVGSFGWRAAYLGFGLLIVCVGPALALTALRNEPTQRDRVAAGTRSSDALRSRVFLTVVAGFFLVSVGANGCVAHLVPLLTDRGYTPASAASVAAVLGLSSISGRLGTGFLLDRFFAPRVGFWFVAGSALGLFALAFTTNNWGVYAGAALLGLAMGAEADFFPYLISRYMGLASFSELYGYAFSAYAVAGATGPFLMGFVHDQAGSYQAALIAGAATTAVAAALLWTLPAYRRHGS